MTTSLSGTSTRVPPAAVIRALRVVIALGVLAVLVQSVLGGEIVSHVSGARMVHSIVAMVVAFLSLLQLVLALIAWRRGAVSGRLALLGTVVFIAVVGQLIAGSTSMLAVHVPLGVALFGGYVWLLIEALRA